MSHPTSHESHSESIRSYPSQAMSTNRCSASDCGSSIASMVSNSCGMYMRSCSLQDCIGFKSKDGTIFVSRACSMPCISFSQRGTRCGAPTLIVPNFCVGIPQKPPSGFMSVSPSSLGNISVSVRNPPVGRGVPDDSSHWVAATLSNASW